MTGFTTPVDKDPRETVTSAIRALASLHADAAECACAGTARERSSEEICRRLGTGVSTLVNLLPLVEALVEKPTESNSELASAATRS